jgi:hypothetical protein
LGGSALVGWLRRPSGLPDDHLLGDRLLAGLLGGRRLLRRGHLISPI